MELIPLNLQPHKGIGLELDAEQLAALEKIRAVWSEDVRASRIVVATTGEMVKTFEACNRLVERDKARNRARCERIKGKASR